MALKDHRRKRPFAVTPEPRGGSKKSGRSSDRAAIPGAVRRPVPKQISPELATLVEVPPSGDEWLHEIKFDGYRLVCRIDGPRIRLLTRNHLDWTERFPSLVSALKHLPLKQAILDGEVTVLDEQGVSSFQRLQNAFRERSGNAFHFYAFDLIYLDGQDLQLVPLEERKRLLERLLKAANEAHLHYCEHVAGDGSEFFRQCCRMGLEGMISKRRDCPYTQARTTDWIKTKCAYREEFVIGGFTEPAGSREGFGALLLGRYNQEGELIYVGKVGTGFTAAVLRDMSQRLTSLQQRQSPFTKNLDPAVRQSHFVRPNLVGQIAFASWTADGLLRHASFQGLREDLPPTSVTSYEPQDLNQLKSARSSGFTRES